MPVIARTYRSDDQSCKTTIPQPAKSSQPSRTIQSPLIGTGIAKQSGDVIRLCQVRLAVDRIPSLYG